MLMAVVATRAASRCQSAAYAISLPRFVDGAYAMFSMLRSRAVFADFATLFHLFAMLRAAETRVAPDAALMPDVFAFSFR